METVTKIASAFGVGGAGSIAAVSVTGSFSGELVGGKKITSINATGIGTLPNNEKNHQYTWISDSSDTEWKSKWDELKGTGGKGKKPKVVKILGSSDDTRNADFLKKLCAKRKEVKIEQLLVDGEILWRAKKGKPVYKDYKNVEIVRDTLTWCTKSSSGN